MVEVSRRRFEELVGDALDEVPEQLTRLMDNVVVLVEERDPDDPDLLGLYEGVPLTHRGNGWSGMLPDKITLFKNQILQVVHDDASLFEQIKRTLWHEIAHYYGLDHDRMHHLQNNPHSQ